MLDCVSSQRERRGAPPGAPEDNQETLVMRPSERPMLPRDPSHLLTAYAPPSQDLLELARLEAPDSGGPESLKQTTLHLPPMAPDTPEWTRAARAMADAFEQCIERGEVDPLEKAAIERAWFAWTMGGVTPRQVMKVMRLVSHAHRGLFETHRDRLHIAVEDAAVLLFNGLPSVVRSTVPLDRVRRIVQGLTQQPDAWIAVVEGTVELLGWKDFAQAHAASILRNVIDHER
jgi:hypothetical protein